MTCHAVRGKLSEYLDGELNEAEGAVVASHLEACAPCRRVADDLRGVESALRALAQEEHAPDLIADLRRRLAAKGPGPSRWVWAGAAAVAVILVGASMLIWNRPRSGRTPVAPTGGRQAADQQIARSSPKPFSFIGEVGTMRVRPATQPTRKHAVRPRVRGNPRGLASGKGRSPEHVVPAPTRREDLSGPAERAVPAPQPVPTETAEAPAGVILILGEPAPVLPSGSCYIEITRPDGAKSSASQVLERDAAGRPSAIEIAYHNTAVETNGPR